MLLIDTLSDEGESYVIEFDVPDGALATVLPNEIEPTESDARRRRPATSTFCG